MTAIIIQPIMLSSTITWRACKSLAFLSCCASLRLCYAFQFPPTRRNLIASPLKKVNYRDHVVRDLVTTEESSLHAVDGRGRKPAGVADEKDELKISQHLVGTLVLLTVPLSWGTYGPVVRYMYAIQPPVPGFVFSACYYALAAVTTTTLAILQSRSSDAARALQRESQHDPLPSLIPVKGGIELGLYLFIANCFQVVGLRSVESDRAGFLVQLTTVMVPLVEAIFAGNLSSIPRRTWAACLVAFGGLLIMGLDGKDIIFNLDDPLQSLFGAISSFSEGDFLIVGAAVLYSLHVVRLGSYARKTTPIALAASKATAESIFSFLLIGVVVTLSQQFGGSMSAVESDSLFSFAIETGAEITSFFNSFGSGVSDGSIPSSTLAPAFGAILWTGWITCGYTIWAQSFGQARIRWAMCVVLLITEMSHPLTMHSLFVCQPHRCQPYIYLSAHFYIFVCLCFARRDK